MQRSAMSALVAWKNRSRRKPLILQGARQVGKTWLIQEFGRTQFERTAYVSFYDNQPLSKVFDGSLEPKRLLDALSLEAGFPIDPKTTLLVFDEVQACPRALMSLKAFNEQMPELAIIAAGSLLGVALHHDISFPVGKVSWLKLLPMTFGEFLRGVGEDGLADLLEKRDFEMIDAYRERFVDRLKQYYFVGGMPEAVATFAETGDYTEVRTVQQELLVGYEHDFSKYASAVEAERIRMVWQSVPSQLARENRKFLYSAVRPSGRAREFEMAIRWLEDAGLLIKVPRISKPGLPLSAYEDLGSFKLYLLDVGLLGARSGLRTGTVLDGSQLFEEFKGSLTEQFVCQQLVAHNLAPWYWSAENSGGEVDFIYEHNSAVVPVEVKAAENLRARSLRAFCSKYGITDAVRTSMSPYRREEWLTNVPLYATDLLPLG